MPIPTKGPGIQWPLLTINRICKRKYLNFLYAPDGKRGKYFVYSELIGDLYDARAVKGHIVRVNGKMKREWLK